MTVIWNVKGPLNPTEAGTDLQSREIEDKEVTDRSKLGGRRSVRPAVVVNHNAESFGVSDAMGNAELAREDHLHNLFGLKSTLA